MSIIPLLPALHTDRLLADSTPQSWCRAPLSPPLSLHQFSTHLLSITHPAILPTLEIQPYPIACTFSRRYPRPALVLNSNPCFLWFPSAKSYVSILSHNRNIFHSHRELVDLWALSWVYHYHSIPHPNQDQCHISLYQLKNQFENVGGQSFFELYAFHHIGPIPTVNRSHTITYTAWIILSNAPKKFKCNNKLCNIWSRNTSCN